MNKSSLFIVFLVITNALIFIFVDSIYCSADLWLIFFGLSIQSILTFLVLQDFIPSKKKSKDSFLNKENSILIILCSFTMIYAGNLGVDITGRTDDCPNTWIQYMKK